MSDHLLTCSGLTAGYAKVPVVTDVALCVGAGEGVGLLGRKGVGKKAIAQAIAGTIPLMGGEISFEGRQIGSWAADARARVGLRFAPDYRGVFRGLTVEENFMLAANGARNVRYQEALPGLLRNRARQTAARLSGGEQQVLAIACALASSPRVLVLDELSEGLSAIALDEMLSLLTTHAQRGMGVLLVEQRIEVVMRVASRCYILDFAGGCGGIVAELSTDALRQDPSTAMRHLSL